MVSQRCYNVVLRPIIRDGLQQVNPVIRPTYMVTTWDECKNEDGFDRRDKLVSTPRYVPQLFRMQWLGGNRTA